MTYAEVVLWQSLKGDKLGVRFRRQVPIEKLIVDFACLAKHLVVEVDGDHHRGPNDRRRDAWLRSQGFFVMRFWNDEVVDCTEGCVEDVVMFLNAPLWGKLSRSD